MYPTECRFPDNAKNRGKQQNGNDQRSHKKTGDISRLFHAKIATIKNRSGRKLEAEDIKKSWQ